MIIEVVRRNVQKDRGISIPGTPIGCDFDIEKIIHLKNLQVNMRYLMR